MSTLTAVIGRILIGAYFIVTGAIMLIAPAPSDALFATVGLVPGTALLVGLVEVIAGFCLALGALTRLTAVILALWSAITIALFHPAVTSPAQVPDILLQAALIGGLLLVFAHSQMWWSWDAMRRDRRDARRALDAEQRAHRTDVQTETRLHDAELRAARAEGRAASEPAATTLRRRWF